MRVKLLWLIPLIFITTPCVADVELNSHNEPAHESFVWPIDCVRPKTANDATFCEQRAATNEARFAGLWTLGSFLVSTMTLMAVIIGFRQSRETQQQEYRAYLNVAATGVAFDVSVGGFTLTIGLENYGRTIAGSILIEASVSMETDGSGSANLPFGTSKNFRVGSMHPTPGRPIEINLETPVTIEYQAFLDALPKTDYMHVEVTAIFTDVFGRVYRSEGIRDFRRKKGATKSNRTFSEPSPAYAWEYREKTTNYYD